MFGGLFTVAVPNMPDFFHTTTRFVPHGWAMRVFSEVLEGGALTGSDTMTFLAILVAAGAGFFALGSAILGRRLARG
jgi:hypothetical protein